MNNPPTPRLIALASLKQDQQRDTTVDPHYNNIEALDHPERVVGHPFLRTKNKKVTARPKV